MTVEEYIEKWISPAPDRLQELEKETWQKLVNPRMCSGHYQGRLLSLLSKMLKPQHILELGTYSGYSAMCLLEGLRESGKLDTVEVNDELSWIHQKYLNDSRVEVHYQSAENYLQSSDLSKYDLVWLDADKANYLKYFELLTSGLRSGSILMVDNVLWSGKVLTEAEAWDKDTQILQQLNQEISQHAQWEAMIIPIRDGITLARKR